MKKTERRVRASSYTNPAHNRRVQQEIEEYLAALHSYPLRMANRPYVSFERYLFGILATHHQEHSQRAHRR